MIITKKYASLLELQKEYSVDDILDFIELIELESDIEIASHKDSESNSKS